MERSGHGLSMTILCFSLQMFWVVSALSARSGNETDKLSLLEFKANIDEDPLGLLGSWNESAHFCSWPGVTCSPRHQQRVTRLDLPSWWLKGQLSPHVGNLSFLGTLNLANNSFSLKIPPEIGRLHRLRVLNFRNNSFSGEIPRNLTRCSMLQILELTLNNLTGRIPEDIGSLSELSALHLSHNKLVGEIPASIGNLSSLLYLYLSINSLKGTIPHSLSLLKNLKDLVLSLNSLTGMLPLALYNVSTIEYFALHENKLEGSLPPNLGHTLPNLEYFFFQVNNFSGVIPATISNASNLVLFQISSNNFTGKVPSFARSSNLETLGLFFNNLGYAESDDLNFLNDLVNCTNIKNLGFGGNNLGGAIPESISNMTRLSRLGFSDNQISGNIPTGIGNLVNLKILQSGSNHLSGPIPSTLGRLRNMYLLGFEDNKLSGMIPSALGNLTWLSKLRLSRNNIQGNIPPSLGECTNLQVLELAENNLSGPIPSQVISLSSLSQVLDLSSNRLTGSIPLEVKSLVNLRYLDISKNKLSGQIPKTLGSCLSMEYLYLRGNLLEGSVPEELKALRGIQKIDLSRNNLSGKIPDYFADFRALDYLNLSFNDFEGQVPRKGVFRNASEFSIMGNKRLCGGLPELKLHICTSDVYNKNHELSPKMKSFIIVACVVVALVLIVILVLGKIAFRLRKPRKPILDKSIAISLPRFSYGDLFKATGGFSSANLIGAGSFGSVYKGTLNREDTLIAVKVLNLQVSRALKSFLAECESLRIIKHRNLVKILTVCSGIDFQRNDFKALVYEFMENGNLEKWLHSYQIRANTGREPSQSCSLNLIQRVNIAVDVASALNYLHNHCPESIAHCDIKPSNILLDADMVAHLGDFGLAKLLKSISSSSTDQISSIGIRGTVGYVAPEYAIGSEVSTLGDVYSFGILLLEMFMGKRPTDNMFKDDFNLNNFASAALPDRISEIVDPMLLEEELGHTENDIRGWDDLAQVVQKSLVSIIEIGVACSSRFLVERRKIDDVAAELGRIRGMLDAHRLPRNRARNA